MSVRKRKWVTRKGEEKEAWIVQYPDQDGVDRIKTFARKKEADAYQDTVRSDVRRGMHTPPSKSATIAQACESWIDLITANGMKGRGPAERATIRQYRQHIDLHIVPRLGASTKLAQLNRKSVEQFQAKLLKELSRPLAKKVFTSFRSVLKVAGHTHIADGLSIGTQKRTRKIEAGTDFPTTAEIKRLIDTAQGEVAEAERDTGRNGDRRRGQTLKHHALLLTVALTGLRASELRGLRWKDVDLKTGEIHVRQRADRYKEIGAPKSNTSIRTLPLDPGELTAALKAWKLACPKGEEGLVFPSSTGAIEHHSNMLKSLGPTMRAAGVVAPAKDKDGKPIRDGSGKPVLVPKYGLHAFRHFFASWCINPKNREGRELPAKEVQTLMGHSSIAVTIDLYGHMFQKTNDRTELAASAAALLK